MQGDYFTGWVYKSLDQFAYDFWNLRRHPFEKVNSSSIQKSTLHFWGLQNVNFPGCSAQRLMLVILPVTAQASQVVLGPMATGDLPNGGGGWCAVAKLCSIPKYCKCEQEKNGQQQTWQRKSQDLCVSQLVWKKGFKKNSDYRQKKMNFHWFKSTKNKSSLELKTLTRLAILRRPQSWCFIEVTIDLSDGLKPTFN